LRKLNSPQPVSSLPKGKDIDIGRVRTFIRRIETQITEDFGDRRIGSYPSGDYDAPTEEVVWQEDIEQRSIPSITTKEFPRAGVTMHDIEMGY